MHFSKLPGVSLSLEGSGLRTSDLEQRLANWSISPQPICSWSAYELRMGTTFSNVVLLTLRTVLSLCRELKGIRLVTHEISMKFKFQCPEIKFS